MDASVAFSGSADPTCMYMTKVVKDAVIRFRRAIQRKQGLCCILGDNGLGKSSLLKFIASVYEADSNCVVSYFPDGRSISSSFNMVTMIAADFGIPPKRSLSRQLSALEDYLTESHDAGRTTILCIDEAQRLSLDMLETIRAMLNYETNTEKLLQVVVSGQLQLRDRLLKPDHKSFRSRIAAPLLMTTFSRDDTVAMIKHRLDYWNIPDPFTSSALYRIHELSNGVPRDVVLLCQNACDIASDEGRESVTADDVDTVARSLSIIDPEPVSEATLA